MVTLAQRITELREERGMSRPALAQALGLPKLAIEKFETGRQTPTQAQQDQMAAFFGVSTFYLQGKGRDRTRMDSWMDMADADSPEPPPVQRPIAPPPPRPVASSGGQGQATLFDSLLSGKQFQDALSAAVLEVLRSPQGQELLSQVIRKELGRK